MPAEYYINRPTDPLEVLDYVKGLVNEIVGRLLAGTATSLTLRLFFEKFGPVATIAEEINKAISREGDYIRLDAERIAIEHLTQTEIASFLMTRVLVPALTPIMARPLAYGVAAIVGVGSAVFIWKNFIQPPLNAAEAYFGTASTKIELATSNGALSAGVLYRAGLEGLSEIDAVKFLIGKADDAAPAKPNVGSRAQFFVNGSGTTSYDLLEPNLPELIGQPLGVSAATVEGWSWAVNAAGQAVSNSNIFIPYFDKFTILQTTAKIALSLPEYDRTERIALPKNAIIIDGKAINIDPDARDLALFGSVGNDEFDLNSFQRVHAYGGLGVDTIRGGRGNDVLWGDIANNKSAGSTDYLYGGAGNDQIFGGGGDDQLFGEGDNDTILGHNGDDTIDGGSGIDTVWGGLGEDTIHGGADNDIIRGGDDARDDTDHNTLYGDAGKDVIFGAFGEDTITGGSDDDYLDGAPGTDTAFYDDTDTAQTLELSSGGKPPEEFFAFGPGAFFTLKRGSETDVLHSIEKIKLSDKADTLNIAAKTDLTGLQEIDAGGQGDEERDVLNLRPLGSIEFEINKIKGTNTEFKNFEVIDFDPGKVTVILKGPDAASLQEVNFGDDDDTIWSDVINLTINFGNGHNRVEHAGRGSVVNLGSGINEIFISDDVLVVGADNNDIIATRAGTIIHGAVGRIGSESPWITGPDGTRYGLNHEGQLGIKDALGNILFLADYTGGPDVPEEAQMAHIFVGLQKWYSSKLLDLTFPYNENIPTTFKAGNQLYYVKTGKTIFDQSWDPLVLDLNGDGVRLTRESVRAPMFDMKSTGFAVHTGWVQSNDGNKREIRTCDMYDRCYAF